MSDSQGGEQAALLHFLYLVPVGLVRTDDGGHIINMNPMATNWLSLLSEGEIAANIFDALMPAVLDLRQRVKSTTANGQLVSDAYFYLPGDDNRILSLEVHRIPGSELAFVINDVTERMSQRQAILRRDAQLRAIFDTVRQHMIVLLDSGGRVTDFNASIKRLTGYDESVIGEPLAAFFARAADAQYLLDQAREHGMAEIQARMINLEGGGWWGDSVLSRVGGGASEGEQAYSLVSRESTERHVEEQLLRDQASRDPLTGLLNRRGFADAFEQLQRNRERRSEAYSLLIIDLDLFKSVNDRFGHPAGDRVLIEVVARVNASVRERDRVARLGGEELAVLAPGADATAARALAERCRGKVAEQPIAIDSLRSVGVTISIGLVTFAPGDGWGGGLGDLYERADRALYRAKDNGRNRVEVG